MGNIISTSAGLMFKPGGALPAAFAYLTGITSEGDWTTAPTDAIDTTGATLIVISASDYGGVHAIGDNKGNTWTLARLETAGGDYLSLYYCINPIVGTGHTFAYTASVAYSIFSVAAFSGPVHGVGAKASSGLPSATAIQAGNVTATSNSICISTLSHNAIAAPTIDGGFTTVQSFGDGISLSNSIAWRTMLSSTSANPTWTVPVFRLNAINVLFTEATGLLDDETNLVLTYLLTLGIILTQGQIETLNQWIINAQSAGIPPTGLTPAGTPALHPDLAKFIRRLRSKP